MENDIIDNLANKVKILTHQLTNANLKIEKLEEKLYEQETNYDFSYQIDKNKFIRCIKALEQYSKFSNSWSCLRFALFHILVAADYKLSTFPHQPLLKTMPGRYLG